VGRRDVIYADAVFSGFVFDVTLKFTERWNFEPFEMRPRI
jgi:hypothetical protein